MVTYGSKTLHFFFLHKYLLRSACDIFIIVYFVYNIVINY